MSTGPYPLSLPLSMVVPVLALCVALGCARCTSLTPGTVGAIEAANALACAGASLLPIGGVVALACPGEEAALAAALTAAQVHPDAGVGASAVLPLPNAGTTSHALVTRATGSGRVAVGYVPRGLAGGVQARLDGAR